MTKDLPYPKDLPENMKPLYDEISVSFKADQGYVNETGTEKFNNLTDGYNFDQEFRYMAIMLNKNIKEIPIKTKYGDERSQIHIKYAINFFFKTILFFLIKLKIVNSKKFN